MINSRFNFMSEKIILHNWLIFSLSYKGMSESLIIILQVYVIL